MFLIQYKTYNFREKTLGIIEAANNIIDEYISQGDGLTLRQLYYQFVARDLIPNTQKSYNVLKGTITKGRMAGLIPWDAIEDRTRESHGYYVNEDIEYAVSELGDGISYDRWADQDYYIEAWIEKDALGEVLSRPCYEYRVRNMACKGYLSASEAWAAGRRFREQAKKGKKCIMLHLGDHDSSGIDMTRDNEERLQLFSESFVEVRRLALNMDQIEEYKPPSNPAKMTDPRAKEYIKIHGDKSWELDALSPSVIRGIVSDAIKPLIDWDLWHAREEEEEEKKQLLNSIGERWEEVERFLVE